MKKPQFLDKHVNRINLFKGGMMKKLVLISLIWSLLFIAHSFAETEIVLQNNNSYSGCTDAFMHSKDASTNFGDASEVMVEGPS